MWIVEGGLVDVFAAAPAEGSDERPFGRWHFMCRVGPGTILLGSPPGPRHVLVAKPLPGGRARKIPLGDLRHAQAVHWTDSVELARPPSIVAGQNELLAKGLDAGIEAVHNGVRNALPPRTFTPLEPDTGLELLPGGIARSIGGVLWVRVVSGRIRLGGPAVDRVYQFGDQIAIGQTYWVDAVDGPASLATLTTADLIADGTIWQSLLMHQARFLYAVDRFIEQRDQTTRSELAARQQSNVEAMARSARALNAVLTPLPAGLAPPAPPTRTGTPR